MGFARFQPPQEYSKKSVQGSTDLSMAATSRLGV
jgi:hypothetical protein